MPPSNTVNENDIVDAVTDLAADDANRDLLDGGVPAGRVAAELPWSRATVSRHCRDLAAAGRLARVDGVAPAGSTGADTGRARPSYLPADHPDAPGDETPDGPPRTVAEVRRADD